MLIENLDYYIRVLDFPNWSTPVCVSPNDDGTFNLYVNSKYTIEQVKKHLPHELRHMERNHFQDERNIVEIEVEADDQT